MVGTPVWLLPQAPPRYLPVRWFHRRRDPVPEPDLPPEVKAAYRRIYEEAERSQKRYLRRTQAPKPMIIIPDDDPHKGRPGYMTESERTKILEQILEEISDEAEIPL